MSVINFALLPTGIGYKYLPLYSLSLVQWHIYGTCSINPCGIRWFIILKFISSYRLRLTELTFGRSHHIKLPIVKLPGEWMFSVSLWKQNKEERYIPRHHL